MALDARNHGSSQHVEEMNYGAFTEDLLRFLDQQNLEQAVLLGHSMGGKTAMVTALKHVITLSQHWGARRPLSLRSDM